MEGQIITIIAIVVFALVVMGLIYHQRKSEKQRQELQLAQEERTKNYVADFQKIGEQYEKSGVPAIESEIALKRGETLHVILRDTRWMEYRKVRTGRVAGHGITGRVRIAKGLYYRYGAGRMVAESIDSLQAIDSGDLYVTNRGILFNGALGNKKIAFGKIISIIPFQNGLKVERDSGKDIYIPYDFVAYPDKAAAIPVLWDKCLKMTEG